MTLRHYCEQMGLHLERWTVPKASDLRGKHVRISDFGLLIDGRPVPAEANGATRKDAEAALIGLIAGRILRSTVRPTTLYWVPKLEAGLCPKA